MKCESIMCLVGCVSIFTLLHTQLVRSEKESISIMNSTYSLSQEVANITCAVKMMNGENIYSIFCEYVLERYKHFM